MLILETNVPTAVVQLLQFFTTEQKLHLASFLHVQDRAEFSRHLKHFMNLRQAESIVAYLEFI